MKNSLFSIFNKYQNLVVTLSKKNDGVMKLTGNPLMDKIIIDNQKKFLNKLIIDIDSLIRADLVHGNTIKVVTAKNKRKKILRTDGLLTNEKNIFLSITVADCLPIFLYDFEKEIVGLIHGGWRSLAKNILGRTIGELKKNFKSQPKNILAGVGPGISQCHFEVRKEVLVKFKSFPTEIFLKKDEKIFMDLKKVAEIQLLNLGLKKENIEINPDCTYCLKNKYFSYRREKPPHQIWCGGTMIAIIGLKSFSA